jgi:hypothetical protein
MRLDFGKSTTPVAVGYTGVLATDLYSAAVGYGWQQSSMYGWDRTTGGDLLRDFHYGSQGTFLMDVPNGQHEVVLTMGDETNLHDQMAVFLEGALVGTLTTQSGQYAINTYLVDVNDGQLTLALVDQGGSNANVVINALEVIVAATDQTAQEPVVTSAAVNQGSVISIAALPPIQPREPAASVQESESTWNFHLTGLLLREGVGGPRDVSARRMKPVSWAAQGVRFSIESRQRFFTAADEEAYDLWQESQWLDLLARDVSRR